MTTIFPVTPQFSLFGDVILNLPVRVRPEMNSVVEAAKIVVVVISTDAARVSHRLV